MNICYKILRNVAAAFGALALMAQGVVAQDLPADIQKGKADNGCGKGFVLAVTVVVIAVFGLRAYLDKDQHYDVGKEVAERVDSIGNHCCRVAHYAREKFDDEKKNIYDRSE